MANKKDQELFDKLRDTGIRKKVARTLSKSNPDSDRMQIERVKEAAHDLHKAATALEDHVDVAARSEAGKKAARTRKRNSTKRSASAKKAARTRARVG